MRHTVACYAAGSAYYAGRHKKELAGPVRVAFRVSDEAQSLDDVAASVIDILESLSWACTVAPEGSGMRIDFRSEEGKCRAFLNQPSAGDFQLNVERAGRRTKDELVARMSEAFAKVILGDNSEA